MSLLANVIGFSLFGFAARVGQLAIQRRSLISNPVGHIASMAAFGFVGYGAYHWDVRAGELIALKRAEIEEKRMRKALRAGEVEVQQ